MTDSIPFGRLVGLFSVLLVAGIGLTIPLFNFNYHKFVHSSLFVKILFWIPLFVIFLGVLYASNPLRITLLIALLAAALIEFFRVVHRTKDKTPLRVYGLFFAFGLAHFYLLGSSFEALFTNLLITVCLATVLSDVGAFFLGSYLGKHKLPAWINNQKSWEGVLGQVLGALVGVLLVDTFVVPVVSIWVFLPLGVGSALGDLANSYAKRKASVKDWSRAVPGHGGFIDRLSSMAGSSALLYYCLRLSGVA